MTKSQSFCHETLKSLLYQLTHKIAVLVYMSYTSVSQQFSISHASGSVVSPKNCYSTLLGEFVLIYFIFLL